MESTYLSDDTQSHVVSVDLFGLNHILNANLDLEEAGALT